MRTIPPVAFSKKGILALFKPKGVTSAAFLNQFKSFILRELKLPDERKRKRKRIKVGHGGTLDKGAEGVLVVGIGNSCKELKHFLEGSKRYRVTGKLGMATDTYDSSGTVTTEMPYENITYDGFISVLTKFTGAIQQKPPVYSALKCGGKRYSDLARSGCPPDPQLRPVTIHSVECTEFKPPLFQLDVHCSSGTYIRSLVHDIGQELESAAHVIELCRSQQSQFSLDDALRQEDWSLDKINDSLVVTKSKHLKEKEDGNVSNKS